MLSAARNAVGTRMWKRSGGSFLSLFGQWDSLCIQASSWAGKGHLEGYWGDWLHLEASGYPGNADPCKQRLKSRRVFEALYGLHTGSGHVLLDVS